MQLTALMPSPKLPAAHASQPRSTMVLGCCTTRSPLAQTVGGWQKPLPVPLNVPDGHGMGSTVPSGQKWPEGQRPEHSLRVSLLALPKNVVGHSAHDACPLAF